VIFEPSAAITGGQLEAFILSSGGPNWGGALVYISIDGGTSYQYAGAIFSGIGQAEGQGVLTANLAAYAGSNPDTVDTCSVDLTASEGELTSVSAGAAANYASLCYVGGELISFETATLTATYKYNLTTLYRGLYGTTPGAHSSGAPFAFIGQFNSPGLFIFKYNSNLIGTTIHVKLVSFNNFDQELQDISTVTDNTYTLTGSGAISVSSIPVQFPGSVVTPTPVLNWTSAEVINFAHNFNANAPGGSVVTAGTAATVTTTFDIYHNSTMIGTMTFAATNTTANFSGVAAFSIAPGDTISIVPNRTDATLANLTGVLVGTS
jgi:hypothetical protein